MSFSNERRYEAARAIERLCPGVRENIPKGSDFRDPRFVKVVVSGLFWSISSQEGPLRFVVRTGTRELAELAASQLKAIGIVATIEAPHVEAVVCDGEECPVRTLLHAVRFEVPEDWTPPE